ncbi:DUF6478 family protein [Paenirhodobacter sp.]|uniref:DUF6478 family protein n=1 Tax=Paenirhodobacter sp. TaxID=1965326 RepID=UPI003B418762
MAQGQGGFWRRWRGRAEAPAPAFTLPGGNPLGCDWIWRPVLAEAEECVALPSGTPVAPGVTLFHDAARPGLILRRTGDGVLCETEGFDGSFVSLSIDLPLAGVTGLSRTHVVRAIVPADTGAARLFCRLNLRHGPNVEQLLRGLPEGGGTAAFDLAYTRMNEKRLEQVWLDVILEAPRRGRALLHDLVVLRHPRADI